MRQYKKTKNKKTKIRIFSGAFIGSALIALISSGLTTQQVKAEEQTNYFAAGNHENGSITFEVYNEGTNQTVTAKTIEYKAGDDIFDLIEENGITLNWVNRYYQTVRDWNSPNVITMDEKTWLCRYFNFNDKTNLGLLVRSSTSTQENQTEFWKNWNNKVFPYELSSSNTFTARAFYYNDNDTSYGISGYFDFKTNINYKTETGELIGTVQVPSAIKREQAVQQGIDELGLSYLSYAINDLNALKSQQATNVKNGPVAAITEGKDIDVICYDRNVYNTFAPNNHEDGTLTFEVLNENTKKTLQSVQIDYTKEDDIFELLKENGISINWVNRYYNNRANFNTSYVVSMNGTVYLGEYFIFNGEKNLGQITSNYESTNSVEETNNTDFYVNWQNEVFEKTLSNENKLIFRVYNDGDSDISYGCRGTFNSTETTINFTKDDGTILNSINVATGLRQEVAIQQAVKKLNLKYDTYTLNNLDALIAQQDTNVKNGPVCKITNGETLNVIVHNEGEIYRNVTVDLSSLDSNIISNYKDIEKAYQTSSNKLPVDLIAKYGTFDFKGWYYLNDEGEKIESSDGVIDYGDLLDVTIYPDYELNSYTLNIGAEGKDEIQTVEFEDYKALNSSNLDVYFASLGLSDDEYTRTLFLSSDLDKVKNYQGVNGGDYGYKKLDASMSEDNVVNVVFQHWRIQKCYSTSNPEYQEQILKFYYNDYDVWFPYTIGGSTFQGKFEATENYIPMNQAYTEKGELVERKTSKAYRDVIKYYESAQSEEDKYTLVFDLIYREKYHYSIVYNLPVCFTSSNNETDFKEGFKDYTLKNPTQSSTLVQFTGWIDEEGKSITKITNSMFTEDGQVITLTANYQTSEKVKIYVNNEEITEADYLGSISSEEIKALIQKEGYEISKLTYNNEEFETLENLEVDTYLKAEYEALPTTYTAELYKNGELVETKTIDSFTNERISTSKAASYFEYEYYWRYYDNYAYVNYDGSSIIKIDLSYRKFNVKYQVVSNDETLKEEDQSITYLNEYSTNFKNTVDGYKIDKMTIKNLSTNEEREITEDEVLTVDNNYLITAYATSINYKITYSIDKNINGYFENSNKEQLEYKDLMEHNYQLTPLKFTKNDYLFTFDGWYLNGEKVEELTSEMFTTDSVNLEAHIIYNEFDLTCVLSDLTTKTIKLSFNKQKAYLNEFETTEKGYELTWNYPQNSISIMNGSGLPQLEISKQAVQYQIYFNGRVEDGSTTDLSNLNRTVTIEDFDENGKLKIEIPDVQYLEKTKTELYRFPWSDEFNDEITFDQMLNYASSNKTTINVSFAYKMVNIRINYEDLKQENDPANITETTITEKAFVNNERTVIDLNREPIIFNEYGDYYVFTGWSLNGNIIDNLTYEDYTLNEDGVYEVTVKATYGIVTQERPSKPNIEGKKSISLWKILLIALIPVIAIGYIIKKKKDE